MRKNIINKISTLWVVASIAALVVLTNPLKDLNQVFASYGYGYGTTPATVSGVSPSSSSLFIKDDCRVNGTCTSNSTSNTTTTPTTTNTEVKNNDSVKTETEVKTNRIFKDVNGKKFSLSDVTCRVSADIANPNFTSDAVVSFTDIAGNTYEADIVKLAKVNSEFNEPIVHGTKPTTFEPNRAITRAEFLAVVLQSHCIDVYKVAGATPFADLTVGDWKNNVVAAALERGIISGDVRDGVRVFRPNDAITKIEAIAILTSMRDLRLEEEYNHSYKDAAASWQDRVLSLVEYLEIEAKSSNFNPNSVVNRAKMTNYIVETIKMY